MKSLRRNRYSGREQLRKPVLEPVVPVQARGLPVDLVGSPLEMVGTTGAWAGGGGSETIGTVVTMVETAATETETTRMALAEEMAKDGASAEDAEETKKKRARS